MSPSEIGQYPPHSHPRMGPCDYSCSPYREAKRQEAAAAVTAHKAAEQIRRLLDEDERFSAVSGATAVRHADGKQGWTAAGYFSFERDGRLYFVSVEPVE
jgi:hypothetical protein